MEEIVMDLENIQLEIQKDSIVDDTRLDTESLKIPLIHSKWYNQLIAEVQSLKKLERQLNKVKKGRTEYYLGKSSDETYQDEPKPNKVLKQDLDLYLRADDYLQDIQSDYEDQQLKIDLIDQFLKQVSQRSFNIKNAIDFMKFKNGL